MRERFLYVAVAVSTLFSFTVVAQQPTQFLFDSFSFDQDTLFGQDVRSALPAPVIPIEKLEPTISKSVVNKSLNKEQLVRKASTVQKPEGESESISQADQFKLQVSVDTALSRILKLTLDYNTLRARVDRFRGSSGEKSSSSWLTMADTNEQNLLDLQALNRKQLTDRDRQLEIVQTRLDAVQSRYDNENVTRLLAEKRLKVMQDRDKKSTTKLTTSSAKISTLANQLEDNQKIIRQLKIQLTDEKLKNYKLEHFTKDSAEKESVAIENKPTLE